MAGVDEPLKYHQAHSQILLGCCHIRPLFPTASFLVACSTSCEHVKTSKQVVCVTSSRKPD